MAAWKDSELDACMYSGSPSRLTADTSVRAQPLVRMMYLQACGTSISTCICPTANKEFEGRQEGSSDNHILLSGKQIWWDTTAHYLTEDFRTVP